MNTLSDDQTKNYAQWGLALSRVKEIMCRCSTPGQLDDNSEVLIEATRHLRQAIELSGSFPKNDFRRFLTIGTAIALYCHLGHYSYVELDRQILLRMSRRYPRPALGDMLNTLGMLYQEHGKIKEAEQMYKRAMKLLPARHPRFSLLVANLDSLNLSIR